MASQLYIGKAQAGFYAVHISPEGKQNYLTVIKQNPGTPNEKEVGVCVSLPALISCLSKLDSSNYHADTKSTFQENTTPPFSPEERTAISDLVKRLKDDELKLAGMKADISAMLGNVNDCAKTVEGIAKPYVK